MGWFGSLFETTVEIEYVDEQGRPQKKRVSKRKFNELMKKAVTEGKATVHERCEVNILDPKQDSPRIENWIVGKDVSSEAYAQFRDRDGRLYAIIYYEKGQPQISLVTKAIWTSADKQFSLMHRQSEAAFRDAMKKFDS